MQELLLVIFVSLVDQEFPEPGHVMDAPRPAAPWQRSISNRPRTVAGLPSDLPMPTMAIGSGSRFPDMAAGSFEPTTTKRD